MSYFSNGTEGEELDIQCADCLIGIENFCPIAFMQMEFNYNQICHAKGLERFKGHPLPFISQLMDTLIKDGECLMKPEIEKALKRDNVLKKIEEIRGLSELVERESKK
jgi:hypothetical protein